MRRSALIAASLVALVVLAHAAPARADYTSTVRSTPGLVAHWPLDETTGAATEALGGLVGTPIGTPAPGAQTARSDDTGAALGLPGASALSVAGVPGHAGSFSLESWVLPKAGSSSRYVFSRGTGSTAGYHLLLDSSGRLVLTVGTGSGSASLTGPVLATTGWRHVAATVAGTQAALFIDGSRVASSTLPAVPVSSAATTYLGRWSRSSTSGFWSGTLDEPAIYAAALPDDVVAEHFRAGADTSAPSTGLTIAPPALGNRAEALFAFTGSKSGLRFSCRLDAGAWTSCSGLAGYTGLRDGDHSFSVQATDRYGGVEAIPVVHAWRVDLTPPDTLLLAAQPQVASAPASVSFASEAGAGFECRLGAAEWAPCSSPVTVPTAAAGSFAVRAVDPAGNADASAATTELDAVSDTAGPASFAHARAAFDIDGVRSWSTVQCRLDATEWGTCRAPLTFDRLAPGPHTIAVRDQRLAAVVGTPSLSWTVTLPAPRLIGAHFPALVSLGSRKAQRRVTAKRLPRLLFQSNVAARATVELRRGTRRVRRWTAAISQGSNVVVLPRAAWLKLAGTRYTLTVSAVNAAGRSATVRRRFDAVRRARR